MILEVVIPSRIDITYIVEAKKKHKEKVVIPSRIDITYIPIHLIFGVVVVVIPSRIDITYIDENLNALDEEVVIPSRIDITYIDILQCRLCGIVVIPSRIDITYISICVTSLYIGSYTEQQEEKFGYRGVFSSSNRRFLCFQIHIRWSSRFRDCIAFPWFSSFPLP